MSSKILITILLASLLLVFYIFFFYRGTGWPLGEQGIEAIGVFVIVLAISAALLIYMRRLPVMNTYAQGGIVFGLLVGLLWVVEISMNNILTPSLPARDILDDIFWVVIALIILIVSIRYSYQTNKLQISIKIGFWSGLSSGAVACLTALIFIVFGMQLLLRDPLNIIEWAVRGTASKTQNMAAYFAYQTLAGALLHLVVLGIIMGTALGLVGGILGIIGHVLGKKVIAKNM